MGIRSFLAFELSHDVKGFIAHILKEARSELNGVRWVPVENIHLTVVFMGDVEEGTLVEVKESVANACKTYGPFDASVSGIGIFGSLNFPRVLWVGLLGDIERMGHFKAALEKRLEPFGVKREERAFRPHLTLGRFKQGFDEKERLSGFIERFRAIKGPSLTFKELCLFKSQLTPQGSIYTKLEAWELSGSK